jgi:hypothetical protein
MNFEVDRTDLRRCRVVDETSAALDPGQARLAVDRFALTSNNITYAVAGEMLNYWAFFPADVPWGRIPVWGFADVVESLHDDLAVGTRVYGYLPMATELVVTPGKMDRTGFTDTAPHRSSMASAYNRYAAHPKPAGEGPAHAEDQRMVLSPLFFTSFLIDDSVADGGIADGDRVVLSSASSKTALGTAFCLRRRGGIEVVGLTSSSNRGFVERLGVYDRVVSYGDDLVFERAPTVFVDIAGSAAVRHAVHLALGDQLVSSMIVGVTHWDAPPADLELPGPPPRMFFAPDRIAARSREWGRDELDSRLESVWSDYAAWTDDWLVYEHHAGPEPLERVYRALLENSADPTVGFVHTLQSS